MGERLARAAGRPKAGSWEPFEILEVEPLALVEQGIPVALLRGHTTGNEVVLFFAHSSVTHVPTIKALDPAVIGFDVSSFRPKVTSHRRCEHRWDREVPKVWHSDHTCVQSSGHDEGENPTPHLCSCGNTLPPGSQPV